MSDAWSRRLFGAGCWLILLCALGHTLGHVFAAPSDPAELLTTMESYHIQGLPFGMTPSMMGVLDLLSWFMSIGLTVWGLFGLLAAGALRQAPPHPRLHHLGGQLASVSALGALALAVVCYRMQVSPPLVFMLATAVLHGAAALRLATR